MYQSDIRHVPLAVSGAGRFPGYRRCALYTVHEYGIHVGNFSSTVNYGFVVHVNHLNEIRVEVKLAVTTADGQSTFFKDIDPNFIMRLLESDCVNPSVRSSFRVENGVGYFNGYSEPWNDMHRYFTVGQRLAISKAMEFIDVWGGQMALLLCGKGRISTLDEAGEMKRLLSAVLDFTMEMSSGDIFGTDQYAIDVYTRHHNEDQVRLGKLEDEMGEFARRAEECHSVLAQYGIDEGMIEYNYH